MSRRSVLRPLPPRRDRTGPGAPFPSTRGSGAAAGPSPALRTGRSSRAGLAAAAAFLLAASVLPAPAHAVAPGRFELLDSSEQSIRFEFHGRLAASGRDEDGTLWFQDEIHPEGPQGNDLVAPQITQWVALPPGAVPTVSVEALESEPLSWPAGTTPEDQRALRSVIPANGLRVGSGTWVHDQWGVSISFLPVTLENDALRYVTHAVFRVTYAAPRLPAERVRAAGERDAFERVYQERFLNYEQGKRWRRAVPPAAARGLQAGEPYFSSTDRPWIKIFVSREDLYQITGQDLQAIGIDLGDVDPLTLRLFSPVQLPLPEETAWNENPAWMDELPIRLEGTEDGVFDSSDRILFLGYGPDTWYTSKGFSPPGIDAHFWDPYTNENVYWLTWGGSFPGDPKRMEEVDGRDVAEPILTSVRDRLHLEENKLFDARPKDVLAGDQVTWEMYWWRSGRATSAGDDAHTVTVELPNAEASDPVELLARFWSANDPRSDAVPPPPDHDLELQLNGFSVDRRQWDGIERQDITGTGSWLVPGDTQQFEMILHSHADPTIVRQDIVYLAWIEATYTRRLQAIDDRQSFFSGGAGDPQSFRMEGFSSPEIGVVDATDPLAPRWVIPAVEAAGDRYNVSFRSRTSESPPSRFLARPLGDLASPRLERDPVPADGYLRERTDPVQMIIVTHEDFHDQAEALAAYRTSHFPGRAAASVAVVDVHDVYDEFSFGRTDPTAIRDFLEFARDAWTGGNPDDGPAFVVLFGDAHVDYRGLVTQDPPNFVPTYTRYYYAPFLNDVWDPRFSSDDFFGLLDGPDDTGMDLFIGRFPVQTASQAETVVEKTVRYEENQDLAPWKNRVTLVADDICQSTIPDRLGWTHTRQTETLSQEDLPPCLERDKLYMVEFGTDCIFTNKPAAASQLLDSMNDGTLVVNFTGHGSETQLADERVFEISSVAGLTNRDRLFLFFTASCSVGKYDTSNEGLAEALLRHPGGGAISVFSAASVASSVGNHALNREFFHALWPGGAIQRSAPVGEAAVESKLSLPSTTLNQRRYIVHGDPAVQLLSPDEPIHLTLRDAETGAALGDTLRRGHLIRLEGEIVDAEGHRLVDFDGEATVRIFDSQIWRRPVGGTDYYLSGVPIHRGTAQVAGGVFQTQFLVPTALRTGLRGDAQIYVYAEDGERDASGCLPHIFVPEDAAPASNDQTGPVIDLTVPGAPDAVPPGDEFSASLSDSSGINISGLVPSRSVIFRLEDGGEIVHAEDVSSLVEFGEDYRSASLHQVLPEGLPEGRRYDLILEASDNRNNRSSQRVSFFLSGTGAEGFGLSGIFNFPNPTEGGSGFYGRINQEAEIEVKVFSLSGRELIRLGPVRMTPAQFEQEGLWWDGRDADGDRPANGVYFYKVTARSAAGGKTESAIQRLVISR